MSEPWDRGQRSTRIGQRAGSEGHLVWEPTIGRGPKEAPPTVLPALERSSPSQRVEAGCILPLMETALPRPLDLRRSLPLVLLLVFLTLTAAGWLLVLLSQSDWLARSFGVDYRIYMQALDRWQSTGQWYLARQLGGPYPIEFGDVLYPPVLIYLLLPFRYAGPILWSVIPAAILMWAVWRLRPAPWSLVLIAACIAWPYTPAKFIFGNPVIWGAAALGLATVHRWPAALLLLKPTVAVFALFGIRDRRWWLMVGVLVLASLPFLADTLRYPEVLLNSHADPIAARGGPLYSSAEFPLLCIPLIAWLGRRREPESDAPEVPV